jgi:glycosyltransferase involved in cell wall biosynthesis
MRVGVDARSLLTGRGVARVTRSLLGALAAAHPQDEWHAFVPGRQAVPPIAGVTLHRHPRGGRVLFGAAAATGRPTLERLLGVRPDVVWIPAPAPVALRRSTPGVLTVHDLSFVQRPQDFTAYERLWHRAARPARLARRATRVVAGSQATAQEVRRCWGVQATVVMPGVTPQPSPASIPAPAPGRYLLFVGALEPRKAPEVLAAAFARARATGLDAELVVVGDGRRRDALEGVAGVRRIAPPDDAGLSALYRGALALVLPSWLEGFGLPPLEALARGTPSVVSDLPALREVLGDAALFVPPGDTEALAAALVQVAGDPALRRELVARGSGRVAELTWERTAEQMHAILADAAGGGADDRS